MSESNRSSRRDRKPSITRLNYREHHAPRSDRFGLSESFGFELLPNGWGEAQEQRAFEAAERLMLMGRQVKQWRLAARRNDDGTWDRTSEHQARDAAELIDQVHRLLTGREGWGLRRRTPMEVIEAFEREVGRVQSAPRAFETFAALYRIVFGRDPTPAQAVSSIAKIRVDLIGIGHADIARDLQDADIMTAIKVLSRRGAPRRKTGTPRKWEFLAQMLGRAGVQVAPETLEVDWGKWQARK